MDLSKLPKPSRGEKPVAPTSESQTPPTTYPTAQRVDPAGYVPDYASPRGTLAGTGGEVWVSAILSVIFLFLGKNFAGYLIAVITGKPYVTDSIWTTGALAGQPVAYADLTGHVMLTDASMFLFGLTLLFEAFVLAMLHTGFKHKRPLLMLSIGVATIAVLFNGYAAVRLFAADVLPMLSLLAIAFGGYIAMYQWKLLAATKQHDPQILS